MLSAVFLTRAFGVFGTGVLASLSPCVYPMLPITLGFIGKQADGRSRNAAIWFYTLGQSLALFAIGIIAVQLGETLGFSSQSAWVQVPIGLLLIGLGLVSWMGKLPGLASRWNHLSNTVTDGASKRGLAGAFLLGVSAALVASPCTSPILGGVLALLSTSSSLFEGMVLMFLYSAGFSLLFLFAGLGVLKASRFPRSGPWLARVHGLSSLLLVGAGLYYLSQPLGLW